MSTSYFTSAAICLCISQSLIFHFSMLEDRPFQVIMASESEICVNDFEKKMESLRQLVTCSICLDCFRHPIMLPCQHTFCQLCLSKIATEKNVQCPQCRETISLSSGLASLPVNIHLQSVIEVLQTDAASKVTCSSCQIKAGNPLKCGHCEQQYCTDCHAKHLLVMKEKLNKMADELKEKISFINEDFQKFQEECKLVNNNIHKVIEAKILALRNNESTLTNEVDSVLKTEELTVNELIKKINTLINEIKTIDDSNQEADYMVKHFIKYRQDVSQLISEITAENSRRKRKVVFDSHSLTITWKEKDKENSILESNENMERHSRFYITKQFHLKCKLVSEMLQRPSGTAVSPWSSEFYVVSTDTHLIHVFDLQNGKSISSFGRRGHKDGEFLCPFGIALCPLQHKIYITDKWKHCIHVFNKDGEYLRQIGTKGRASSQFRSPESICVDGKGNVYVCDTCNNRIQVFNSNSCYHHQIGVLLKKEGGKMRQNSMFQDPTGIAVTKDGTRVVVSDFGHHRIHVFSSLGDHLFTFGQKGNLKGQFLHPECVAVDNKGFILVGDSGNGRIQIFRPDGSYVRMFGCKDFSEEKFNWVSGIAVTDNYEIVVCDFKNHCVQMYL
ncbi:tripartite motif-containing protein 2-like isoform X2 [Centruroides sculpturatus]|uniref:tripartite motif-containing protein 2-like n=1 Tax=Centruroides sculpturatus TaxID=218467 RepID=UPI000C6DF5B4|nr:tripartite motif-containing protein 2-like [Centruroides sculpturatus]XP_023240634.1 tripartite motif-containing protein 2-like isoform X2 [Centruroides sculpturatus]XP_023240635.1 tripartite motif-containing protein 2-like isoform X2 [Centruroides sculpturatus]